MDKKCTVLTRAACRAVIEKYKLHQYLNNVGLRTIDNLLWFWCIDVTYAIIRIIEIVGVFHIRFSKLTIKNIIYSKIV